MEILMGLVAIAILGGLIHLAIKRVRAHEAGNGSSGTRGNDGPPEVQ